MTASGQRSRSPRGALPHGLKFAVPELPPAAVERSRLTRFLDVAAQQPLTVVVAPPGSGKTVLLAQWMGDQPRARARWLTVGPEHNDPLVLLEDLRESVVADHPTVAARPRRRPPRAHDDVRSRFVATLVETFERLPATTLVLDDFHRVTDPVVVDLVAEVLDHAPRSLRVIAVSRVDPPLRLFHLHDHGVLFQLRQEDLAFNAPETVSLVRGLAQVELSERQIDALLDRTDGWAAGLQLAALALRSHENVEEFVAAFAGDDRAVADYLTERVLSVLPAHLRDFLRATCVLDRMSGPLCDYVTGRSDGQAMLDELERRSLFISALDSRRSWFRYHRLFLTYLRSHLVDDASSQRHRLRQAAEWHRRQGDLHTAVAYLLDAGCWPEVLALASTWGARMLDRGEAVAVAGWIGAVPAPERRHVEVALDEAAALLAGGELVRARTALDELGRHARATPEEQAVTHLLRAWCALRTGELDRAIEEADRSIAGAGALGPRKPPGVLGLLNGGREVVIAATIVRGAALLHQGRFRESRVALGVDRDGMHARWQLLALGSLALLEAWSEHLELAEGFANQALRLAEQLGLERDPATLHASLALAVVTRNRGHLDATREVLESASSVVVAGDDDRLTADCLVDEHALLALAEGDAAGGLTAFAGQPAVGPPGWAAATACRRPAVEAEVFLSLGDLERAARSLSVAVGEAPDLVGTRVRLELARGDLPAARDLVTPLSDDPSEQPLGHLLALAVVEHLVGDERAAAEHLDEVVRQAELDGNVGMFRWHEARTYVRSRYRAAPTAFLRAVVEQPVPSQRPVAVKELIEQLTEREYFVLQLLPSRLTNSEIAQSLGISLNTVKTHLKHVYRKLEVKHRSEAIAAAERLGLL